MTHTLVPDQSESHAGLLEEFSKAFAQARFNAIVVPTHRPVTHLRSSISLARRTKTPLIIMCSRAIRQHEVIEQAARAGIEVYAFNMPPGNPLAIDFATSDDMEFSAASPAWNRDLSMKRNIGLVLARLMGWTRLMFLDDDIWGVGKSHVTALAAALENHSISALIPERYPDNSVVCHAHRLGGGKQDVFASASGMGVRTDRDDLAFFPNVYNEDWFFFAGEAASHRIARVGESRQRIYDPFDNPSRAAWEEFGDLLAEGLYARLDIKEALWDVDANYWQDFIEVRRQFHQRVAESLAYAGARDQYEAARAAKSVRAAQGQLEKITPELCQKFVHYWQDDLARWRSYLARLPRLDSITDAFSYLGIKPAEYGSVCRAQHTR